MEANRVGLAILHPSVKVRGYKRLAVFCSRHLVHVGQSILLGPAFLPGAGLFYWLALEYKNSALNTLANGGEDRKRGN